MKLSHAILRTMLTAMLAMFILTPAMAEPRSWQISESTGEVKVNSSGASRPGARGLLLKEGDAVATGPKSRAVLVRGSEFVILSPNSQVRISKPKESGAITQIYQYLGSALFKIEKKETPHFGVKTPYLAAVVKGTTFNVTVTESGATVQVTEGKVEVSTLDGGAADLIVPGRIARVDADDRQLLKVLGNDDRAIRSPLPAQQEAVEPKKSFTPSTTDDDRTSDSKSAINKDGAQTDEQISDTQITENIADTGKVDGFDGRIGSPISGDNVSIAIVTGGLISGSRDNDRAPSDNPGNGNAGGNADNPGNGNAGGNAGGNADNPGNADAGGNAGNPGNADAGGNAGNPGNADAGGNAGNPGNADAGGNAGNPGNADAGGNAGNPGNADAGGNAGNPGNADAGGNAGNPGNADAGGNAVIPGNADAGGNAGDPGNADAGGNAGNPGNADAGGNAGNPGNADAGGNADDGGILDDVDDVVDDVVNPVKGKKDRGDD